MKRFLTKDKVRARKMISMALEGLESRTLYSAASGGAVVGAVSAAASSYNLTQLGTSDWAHWGTSGPSSAFVDNATGGSQISNVTKLGSGDYGGWSVSTRNVSWTNGASTPASTDDGYIWANDATGAGYSFTVPADTTSRTVYVDLGGFSSGGTLTAHLSDGSAANFVTTLSSAGNYSDVVAITYSAASAGQTLTISYTKTQNINGTNGSVDLSSAWLTGGTSGSTTTTTTTTTTSPTTPVTTSSSIAGLTGKSASSGTVTLNWTTPLPSAGTLSIISTVGRESFPSLTLAAGATSATIQYVHPGWELDFQITSGAATSAVATVNVGGSSTAAYSGSPSLQSATTTAPVTPPTVTTPPVTAPPVTTPPVTTPVTTTSGTLLDGTATPGPTNTGPTNSNILTTVYGNIVITTAGEVVQNEHIYGSLEIEAPDVTVKNCIIDGQDAVSNQFCISVDGHNNDTSGAIDCTIENTTVKSSGPSSHMILSSAGGLTIKNVQAYDGGEEGFYLSASATVENCWMYDIGWNCEGTANNSAFRPGYNGLGHSECLFVENGTSFTFTDNNFNCPTYQVSKVPGDVGVSYGLPAGVLLMQPYAAGDVIGSVNFSDNYSNGGGFMFYLTGNADVTINNNILGPDEAYYGDWIYRDYTTALKSWSGNVDQNGNTIAQPT